MVSNSLRATLISLAIAAPSVYAAPTLSLKVTCPETIDGVEDLKVNTTLTNTGGETVKIFSSPNTILDPIPTNKFTIINTDGFSPDFIGVAAKYSPTQAAVSTDSSDFTIIAPGQSVSFYHDLSAAYNFTDTGYGTYTVEASNRFYTFDSNSWEFPAILASNDLCSVNFTSGPLAVAAPSPAEHASFNNCSANQQSVLNAAAAAAQDYARAAHSYLDANLGPSPRYTTWFGEYTSVRHSTVYDHFHKISTNNFTGFSYDCTCTHNTTYAYVYPSRFGTVYLCGAFWRAPLNGTDSQAGTLIHEASNFIVNGGAEDAAHAEYQEYAESLAQSSPDEAVYNAASHEYFAENDPAEL